MENYKTVPMNIQLFAEPDGATTPTDNDTQIDYESEYKKLVAERDALKIDVEKQKKLKDQYATENASYKRKEAEKMTDEEKRSKELQELIDSKNAMEAELKTMKLEKELLANGFTAQESEKIIKGNFAVKDLAEIMNTRLAEKEKSIKAELLKSSTPQIPLGNGTTGDDSESDFSRYQKAKKKEGKEVKLK